MTKLTVKDKTITLAGLLTTTTDYPHSLECTMQPVNSSNIKSVGFDPNTSRIVVQFGSGTLYAYHDMTPELFDGLLNAPSVGSYFHKNIKTNKSIPCFPL